MPDNMIDLDEYLEHHGIVGMKWGQLNGPPYPIASGQHSAGEKRAAKAAGISVGSATKGGGSGTVYSGQAPKKPNIIERHKQKIETDKLQKQRAANLEKARQTKEEKRQHEAEKQEAIKSGDANKVKKFATELTDQELQSAANRINMMQTVNRNLTPTPQEKSVMDKINNTLGKAGRIAGTVETGINIYNRFAKVYNMVSGDKDDLPIIGGEKGKTAADKLKDKNEKKRAKWAQDVIKKNDLDTILKDTTKFTSQELSDANKRLTTIQQLKSKAPKDSSNNSQNASPKTNPNPQPQQQTPNQNQQQSQSSSTTNNYFNQFNETYNTSFNWNADVNSYRYKNDDYIDADHLIREVTK